MSMSAREFVLEVIEEYKSHPCLWQARHASYRDRKKRLEALNALLALFKTKDPEANLDTVKKKITSMRNCFKKEFNKVKASRRSGAGTAEIHVPKLWYYNEMLFLTQKEEDDESVNSILDDLPFEDHAEVHVSNDGSEYTVSSNVQSPLSENNSVASSSRHQSRKTKARADNILAKIAKKIEEPNPPPRLKLQYDSFGEHIAEKLRNMPPIMAIYCQKIINDAIFMAETNNLTIESRIVQFKSD